MMTMMITAPTPTELTPAPMSTAYKTCAQPTTAHIRFCIALTELPYFSCNGLLGAAGGVLFLSVTVGGVALWYWKERRRANRNGNGNRTQGGIQMAVQVEAEEEEEEEARV